MQGPSVILAKAFQLEDDPGTIMHLQEFVGEQLLELFDFNYTYVQQKPEIRNKLQCKIRRQFPHLFDNNENRSNRIWAVNHYARKLYGRRRIRQKGTVSTERSVNREEPKTSGPSPLKPQQTGRHLNTLGKATRTGRRGNTITSYFDNIGTSKSSRWTSPIWIDSPPPPSTSSTNNIPTTPLSQLAITGPTINGPKYCISEVRKFLSTCIPDMQHLLDAFLDYGIRNREILIVLATEWSGGELDKLLKEVFQRAAAPVEGGGARGSSLVPEMDIQILKKHLQRSFVGGEKSN